MASRWICECRPRCASLSECHAPKEAKGAILCAICGDEEVSALGEVCADCLPETACPLCGSFACMDEECDVDPADTREEAEALR